MNQKTLSIMDANKRTFSTIAAEVVGLWRKTYGPAENLPLSLKCALPYLRAMLKCNTTNKNMPYCAETVESVVLYFLANITYWKGDDAKRIKAELKAMLK